MSIAKKNKKNRLSCRSKLISYYAASSSHLYAILSNDVVHLVGGESEDNVFISHLDANGHQSGSKQSIDSAAGSSSDILCSTDSCLFLNAKRNELRVVPFMVDQKKTPSKPSKTAYTHVFSVDLDTKGHFLGERKDGRFDVIKLQSDSYEIVWTFEACDPSSHSPSVWRGYADSKGNVWVIRTYWSYALQVKPRIRNWNSIHANLDLVGADDASRIAQPGAPRWVRQHGTYVPFR